MWEHTVGILIGGQSRRMGSAKHKIELKNGLSMLQMMLDFASNTARQTVIVGGEIDGYLCIHDHRDMQGPVAGIEALLDSGIDERYLLVGCDMPLLKAAHVAPLLCDDEAAVFHNNGIVLGLPLMICDGLKNACTTYLDSGKRSIKGFVSTITHTSIPTDDALAASLTSVNTTEDLNNLTLE